MNTPAKASLPVIKRLPKYYRYLRSLQADGITSISAYGGGYCNNYFDNDAPG